MSENPKCPKCDAPLPPDAPEGLCPRCLVAMNLATQTEIAGETGPHGTKIVKPPLPVEEVAKLFPQLEILECLGRGGMGAVYKARQPRLDRVVALKILSPEKQGEPKFAERFEREARALAKLHHPNIVTVYDFGETQGNFYLLMEFVDGLTLRQLLQTKKFSPTEALGIVPKICEALQYAHEQGIVHRDIKPENILLDKNGRVKIADFGIAKILGSEGGRTNLTEEQAIGTPHYMSPEQIEKPQTVDHRADIYSLGVVFYEMLTGELPLGKFSPPSAKVQIDVRLDEIVLRALEKEPARRYQQASEVKTRVETIAADAGKSEIQNTKSQVKPHFSRTAIAGASGTGFFLIVDAAVIFYLKFFSYANWTPLQNVTITIVSFFNVLGLTAPFATTILGWIAVSQIRRSAGKLCGMWLAVFDGLFFPLLVLDTMIWFLISIAGLAFDPKPIARVHIAYVFEIAAIVSLFVDWIIVRIVWRAVNQPIQTPSPDQKFDRFWRWFVVTVISLTATLIFIALLGMFAAIAIPNFVKARARAQENARHAAEMLAIQNNSFDLTTNFYTGQTWFPQGDLIEITSVQRAKNQTTVKGHYKLISHDKALLALYITTTNDIGVPTDSKQEMQIFKGNGDFELVQSHLVPGLPHVSMYADGHSFAALYFGNKQEAAEERAASWITNEAPASAETWSPSPDEKQDLQKIYYSAKNLAEQGGYEKALQRYLWYFDHSRTNDSEQGVRLSFVLSDWIELGRLYPKARQALIEIRDRDVRQFSEGRGDFKLFMEVSSISHYLGDDDVAYSLFQQIEQRDQPLAQHCFRVAEDLLLGHGDYQKCLDYIGDPQAAFEETQNEWKRMKQFEEQSAARNDEQRKRLQEMAKTNSAFAPPFPELPKFADEHFVKQTRELIEVLIATGHTAEAEKIRDEAVATLDNPRLKSAVEDMERKLQNQKTSIDPNTGLPTTVGGTTKINPATGLPMSSGQTEQIVPNTGLPVASVAKSDASQILAGQPPVVVETFPVSGAGDVEPDEKEIRVRFSKEMTDDSWSWSTAWENSTPEFIGQPHYESDSRTCVVKARLEPDKTYAFWLNSENFHNFKDADGRPAVPYLLIFHTKQN